MYTPGHQRSMQYCLLGQPNRATTCSWSLPCCDCSFAHHPACPGVFTGCGCLLQRELLQQHERRWHRGRLHCQGSQPGTATLGSRQSALHWEHSGHASKPFQNVGRSVLLITKRVMMSFAALCTRGQSGHSCSVVAWTRVALRPALLAVATIPAPLRCGVLAC